MSGGRGGGDHIYIYICSLSVYIYIIGSKRRFSLDVCTIFQQVDVPLTRLLMSPIWIFGFQFVSS